VIPEISQEVLAEMVGTTPPRINGFLSNSGGSASLNTTAAGKPLAHTGVYLRWAIA